MRDISVYDAACKLFVNWTAAYYATIAAALIAPLYVFFFRSLLVYLFDRLLQALCAAWSAMGRKLCNSGGSAARPTTRRRSVVEQLLEEAKANHMEIEEELNPMLPSGGSRHSSAARESGLFSTPNSVLSASRSSRRLSGGGRGTASAEDPLVHGVPYGAEEEDVDEFVEPASPSMRVESDLAIYGQSLKLAMPPAAVAASAHHSARADIRVFSSTSSGHLDAAIQNGEVFYHPASSVLSIESKIRSMFARLRRNSSYRDGNITEQALDELYQRPAFHKWYNDNRADLLQGVQMRANGLYLRSLSSLVVILVGICALPAFSFSNKTWASFPLLLNRSEGVLGMQRLPPGAPTSEATFLQLLVDRAVYIQKVRGLPSAIPAAVPSTVARWVFDGIGQLELALMTTALCALVTSTVMPRGQKFTAATALTALAVMLVECTIGSGAEAVSMHVGMGLGVVVGVVAVSVARALH